MHFRSMTRGLAALTAGLLLAAVAATQGASALQAAEPTVAAAPAPAPAVTAISAPTTVESGTLLQAVASPSCHQAVGSFFATSILQGQTTLAAKPLGCFRWCLTDPDTGRTTCVWTCDDMTLAQATA